MTLTFEFDIDNKVKLNRHTVCRSKVIAFDGYHARTLRQTRHTDKLKYDKLIIAIELTASQGE